MRAAAVRFPFGIQLDRPQQQGGLKARNIPVLMITIRGVSMVYIGGIETIKSHNHGPVPTATIDVIRVIADAPALCRRRGARSPDGYVQSQLEDAAQILRERKR